MADTVRSGDRLTPQAFAEKWRRSKLSERSASQQHFLDLCCMLGQPTPAEADPDGDFYTFERRVAKSGSDAGKGFADVWYRDRFAWEYKGKHRDLGAAYDQILQYREDLENPPLLVVSDMERFEVHTNFERTKKRVYAFTNDDLAGDEGDGLFGDLLGTGESALSGEEPDEDGETEARGTPPAGEQGVLVGTERPRFL